jgi:hypothetical protein
MGDAFKAPTLCKCPYCKKPNWLTAEQHAYEVGIFSGYPKCCINEYIENVRTNTKFEDKRQKAGYYKGSWAGGFIPCTKHADKIIDENKSVARIIRNRICTSRFPYRSVYQFKKYLKKIKPKYTIKSK